MKNLELMERLGPLLSLWRQGNFSDGEMAGLYILIHLQQDHPHHWAQGLSSFPGAGGPGSCSKSFCLYDLPEKSLKFKESLRRHLPHRPSVRDLFGRIRLYSIPMGVTRTMINWLDQVWSLILMEKVAETLEVLQWQVQGTRPVTMLTQLHELDRPVLDKPDPLQFLLHDLEHADRFFHNPLSFPGQLGMGRLMLSTLNHLKSFSQMMEGDPILAKEVSYALADMNSYCCHLFQYLKHVFIRHFLRQNGQLPSDTLTQQARSSFDQFFGELLDFWGMEGKERSAALRLNTPDFLPATDIPVLQGFFDRHGLGN